MLKIGDFSRYTQVSVRSLRHYDEIGLLKPVHVNPESGHRYYSLDQLPRLNRIIVLKTLGIPLKQIAILLNNELSSEALRGMLLLRHSELQMEIAERNQHIKEIERRLRAIEREDSAAPCDVVLKQIPPCPVLSVTYPYEAVDDINRVFQTGLQMLYQHTSTIDSVIGLYHADPTIDMDDLPRYRLPYSGTHLETAYYIKDDLPPTLPISDHITLRAKTLPALDCVATVIYQGPFLYREDTVLSLIRWIDDNGYEQSDTVREIYHRVIDQNTEHPDNLVEIQFPIQGRKENQ